MDDYIHYDLTCLNKKINIKKDNVYLCCYSINDKETNPFLCYLLFKYSTLDLMSFIRLDDTHDIELSVIKYVKKHLGFKNYNINGHITVEDKTYVLCEVKELGYIVQKEFSKEQNFWWATIDEICNSRQIMNIKIHESVTKLFYNHTELIHILDKNKQRYLIPRIGYYGCYYKLLPFITSFGFQEYIYAPFGNNYYFSSYNRSIRYAGWGNVKNVEPYIITDSKNRYNKGSVLRYAVFLKNNKMLLNHKDDNKNDFNSYSKTFIKIHKEFPRIIDTNGDWSKKHDTIYVGELINKDYEKTFHKNLGEQYVVNNFTNCRHLSTHNINTKLLGDTWESGVDYNVLL